MPYLVDDVLSFGDPEECQEILDELMAVLTTNAPQQQFLAVSAAHQTHGSSPGTQSIALPVMQSAHHLCVQYVFELLDLLLHWFDAQEARRRDLDQGMSHTATGSAMEDSNTGGRRSVERKRGELERIPKSVLAEAASNCQAFTRAYMNFEGHIRDRIKAQNQEILEGGLEANFPVGPFLLLSLSSLTACVGGVLMC